MLQRIISAAETILRELRSLRTSLLRSVVRRANLILLRQIAVVVHLPLTSELIKRVLAVPVQSFSLAQVLLNLRGDDALAHQVERILDLHCGGAGGETGRCELRFVHFYSRCFPTDVDFFKFYFSN